MILYHGSNVFVREPRIVNSGRKLDFGTGFYTTSSFEQASSAKIKRPVCFQNRRFYKAAGF